ncbi:transposase [Streptomyces sp. NPDC017259]|uniref:transposase n=1 Tax=Streptomyces sp. NPDC017259 TaxID=3364991 RepID=UPI0037A863F5
MGPDASRDRQTLGERLGGVHSLPPLRHRAIRRTVCTTNAIESVDARVRRAVKARGHVPNETAALECVHMARSGDSPVARAGPPTRRTDRRRSR